MGSARSRKLVVTADATTNQTAWCSCKEGGFVTLEGLFSANVTLQRRGADGNAVNVTNSAGGAVTLTLPGTYPIDTGGVQAEYRLNCPSGNFSVVSDTSTTSNTVGTGSKTFTVTAAEPYVVGQPITITDTNNSANSMTGTVTSYSGTTLVVNIASVTGSGTKTAWTITTTASLTMMIEGF